MDADLKSQRLMRFLKRVAKGRVRYAATEFVLVVSGRAGGRDRVRAQRPRHERGGVALAWLRRLIPLRASVALPCTAPLPTRTHVAGPPLPVASTIRLARSAHPHRAGSAARHVRTWFSSAATTASSTQIKEKIHILYKETEKSVHTTQGCGQQHWSEYLSAPGNRFAPRG